MAIHNEVWCQEKIIILIFAFFLRNKIFKPTPRISIHNIYKWVCIINYDKLNANDPIIHVCSVNHFRFGSRMLFKTKIMDTPKLETMYIIGLSIKILECKQIFLFLRRTFKTLIKDFCLFYVYSIYAALWNWK